ncbi:GH92 family glycosyl hydrolase [Dysgonomonas sp. Marseille-P4677]|uniref:GH92 family glycosyl hydrolase n=1 Tax=Dysgonomonas sp. Marseille-P4677 TaxID=2364790 RepID=UPI0019146835|nr:GH92 family glycosyl hydrolase [Dysgonomonas sp. Marseille-P4677]MBK5720975.1 GH92 family glycosyl hydrolase [Dysgonomonas sp. Marseille-P4677]
MKRYIALFITIFTITGLLYSQNKRPVDWVNSFIGTTNFGTTNPGAVVPNGMMSVVPFNVMGSKDNAFDKDARWWSTPYEYTNVYFTGYSHVNLSGVGCPDLGSLLIMPTTGELNVDYKNYGSRYSQEKASPGYYSNRLTKYDILTEVTSTIRTGVHRYTYPKGQANVLLNLGQGLTNESGAFVRFNGANEVEGMKMLGTFCYNSQAIFPIYFVTRIVGKEPSNSGFWKKQRPVEGVKAAWDPDQGRYKIYDKYRKDIAGDDIGAWFSFDMQSEGQIEVQIGVSFVSIENARLNLDTEIKNKSFDTICSEARETWNNDLSRIIVEGGTDDQKTVFYTALYHSLIHPNVLNDVNGEYPAMESDKILKTDNTRYTVFSLWDTYRNLHQLMTLVWPDRQTDMVRSMIDMYREWGWMPKWELYGRETWTMEGDPSIPVITDTWLKGLRDFDIETAYEAFHKSATMQGINYPTDTVRKGGALPDSYYASLGGEFNRMRPDNNDYMRLGYVPLRSEFDNSVSHALEYYIADHSLSQLAQALGKKDDAAYFKKRSLGYKSYYSPEYGTFRPILPNGQFLSPFNPQQGMNFEENPGFHEGSAWNYTFYVPHDVTGLAKLMGGKKKFVDKLEMVFEKGYYDPANEPDIAYPHLFSYFKGEEWRTQYHVRRLLDKYYTTKPDGIPGNDDTGTMSAWAVFNMMGFYPDCPGSPYYTLTSPVFDRIVIKLDNRYYSQDVLVIESKRNKAEDIYIKSMTLGGKPLKDFRVSHQDLIDGRKLIIDVTSKK